MFTYVHTYINTHIYRGIRAPTYAHTHTRTHIYIHIMKKRPYKEIHTQPSKQSPNLYNIYVQIYLYTRTYI